MLWGIVLLCFFLLEYIECWSVKGLSPESIKQYQSRIIKNDPKGELFYCLDDSRYIPTLAINDNFCDCVDGSDEPGTPACTQRSRNQLSEKIQFWCENKGHESQNIPRWKVNDRICDCCDGSDEIPFGSFNDSSLCPNTCDEEGKARRMETKRMTMEYEKGLTNVKKLANKGSQLRKKWKNEKDNLYNREIPDLKKKIELEKERLSALKAKLTVADPTQSSIMNDTALIDDRQQKEIKMREEVAVENERKEGVSEYSQWMEKENADEKYLPDHAADDVLTETNKANEVDPETSNTDKEAGLSWLFLDLTFSWIRRWWASQFGLDAHISKVSKRIDALESSLREAENRETELHKKLNIQGGMSDQFLPLMGKCFRKVIDKYTYKLCFLETASQKDGQSKTNLGEFTELIETEDNTILKYTNGARCWNGPNRSVTVKVMCGSKTEILSIAEEERCVYTATMTSPAACAMMTIKNKDAQPQFSDVTEDL